MKLSKKNLLLAPTYTGATGGFLAFLFLGAIPGLLYGGYMGLMMTASLFGTPVEPTMMAKLVTGGGMLIGLVSSLFFFLVMGALLGTVAGLPFMPLLKSLAKRSERQELAAVSK
ncbi:MAG: hypothetical protein AUK47_03305 [Deltaproteobacteria bacterium CG2_30_63_29]|nr:MAG: hypothetical protein AUK47_03305 [Deltaproteobacteria bacterium CG2_30_63_29]PJB36003.1 MAG: hypothetical protein CO108_24420 [Deltaproteobacteria bacterium CG_4_9_14_3_um_filter_63_12]